MGMTSQPPGCPPGMRVKKIGRLEDWPIGPERAALKFCELEPIPPGEATDEDELDKLTAYAREKCGCGWHSLYELFDELAKRRGETSDTDQLLDVLKNARIWLEHFKGPAPARNLENAIQRIDAAIDTAMRGKP